jgi:hypothetical protein
MDIVELRVSLIADELELEVCRWHLFRIMLPDEHDVIEKDR